MFCIHLVVNSNDLHMLLLHTGVSRLYDTGSSFNHRHGRNHNISPTHVNYRANVYALKEEGCTHVIVTTACGSLREEIHPGDVVLLDQFIDRTTKRTLTFYDGTPGAPEGICHMQMGEPFCKHTRAVIARAADILGITCHPRGTAVTIEGPRFSTRAESDLYRSWGCDVVNMTTVPEVTLAKELGLCYSSIALPTDYDCWKEEAVCAYIFCPFSLFTIPISYLVCVFMHTYIHPSICCTHAAHTRSTEQMPSETHTHIQSCMQPAFRYMDICTHNPQVNVDMVCEQMKKNSEFALRLIVKTVDLLSREDCSQTLRQAQVSDTDNMPYHSPGAHT